MESFIKTMLVEIEQFPRYGTSGDLFTVKDYFFYDSNIKEYGYRSTVIPVDLIENKDEIPDQHTMRIVINNKVPIMKRVIDINNQKETWIFQTSNLKGLDKNDY